MTTEDAFTDRLSDYLDGEDLSARDRAEIAAHLETCARCQTTLAELQGVAARAASLPDAVPTVDLWAGVAARLAPSTVRPFAWPGDRRFSFTLPQLVAAGLALMVLSGGLVSIMQLDDPRASLPQADAKGPDPIEAPIARSSVAFADPNYDQAVADLEQTLEAGRSRLDAGTVRILEDNLRAIDQAIEQARKALRSDPNSVYLNNHFAASRNRKLALLRRASALTMAQDSSGL